jgi:NitT/TauT family transport system substrate-binding protein
MHAWTGVLSRRLVAVLTVATLAVLLTVGSGVSTAAELMVVKRSNGSGAPQPFGLPWYVADEMGFFAKHGIKFEELYVKGDANSMRALIAKESLVGGVGPTTMFSALTAGAKVKVIVASQPIVDYHIIAHKSVGTKLSDLKGVTFASAGPMDLTTEIPKMVLRKNGIDPKSVSFQQVGSHAARLQAVISGRVKATMINTLYTTIGHRAGDINIITPVAMEFPGLGYTYLAVREEDLSDAKMRKALKGFVHGTIEGSRFIMDHPEQAADVMHKILPDVEKDLLLEVIKRLNATHVWGVNGGVKPEITEFTVNVQMEMGGLKQKLTADQVLDRSLVEEVIAEIGLYKG